MRLCKRVLFVVLTVFTLVFAYIPVSAETGSRIYLEGRWDETGIYILYVFFEAKDTGFCGLELDVTYDTELLTLSSCERGSGLSDLNFDCSLNDGRVRLLFWGTKNSHNGGRLATICFVAAEESGECEFSLSLPTNTSLVRFENNRIIAMDASLSGLRVSLENEAQGGGQESPSADISGENPSASLTQMPEEMSTELTTEPPTERPTERQTEPWLVPQTMPVQNTKRLNTAKNTCLVLACMTSVIGAISIIPLFLPDIFRKGYF